MILKDEALEDLSKTGVNIAQFVSFGPEGRQRFSRIRGVSHSFHFATFEAAVSAIHATQTELKRNVNIRTFLPDKPNGNPFIYGPKHGFNDPKKAVQKLQELLSQGYYAIVNETIDENDGGFSGVLFGDLFEFTSRDIPRCVEKPGCAALSRALATKLIRTVYGFDFFVPYTPEYRVECSIHPETVGCLGERQIIWQAEKNYDISLPVAPTPYWPNRYSRDIGDKAYGLLIAHILGFPVPITHVFGRFIPYFVFGFGTRKWDGENVWLRTCPFEQQGGRFATLRGWGNPASLLNKEDPTGKHLASIILQEGIKPEYSGGALIDSRDELIIEGKAGYGDTFMMGENRPEILPQRVKDAIFSLGQKLREKLGAVRFEWVFDGSEPWLVQLHVGRSESRDDVIYPGEPTRWIILETKIGLDGLRELAQKIKDDNVGIKLLGEIGITSHFGDILRKAKIPSRLCAHRPKEAVNG